MKFKNKWLMVSLIFGMSVSQTSGSVANAVQLAGAFDVAPVYVLQAGAVVSASTLCQLSVEWAIEKMTQFRSPYNMHSVPGADGVADYSRQTIFEALRELPLHRPTTISFRKTGGRYSYIPLAHAWGVNNGDVSISISPDFFSLSDLEKRAVIKSQNRQWVEEDFQDVSTEVGIARFSGILSLLLLNSNQSAAEKIFRIAVALPLLFVPSWMNRKMIEKADCFSDMSPEELFGLLSYHMRNSDSYFNYATKLAPARHLFAGTHARTGVDGFGQVASLLATADFLRDTKRSSRIARFLSSSLGLFSTSVRPEHRLQYLKKAYENRAENTAHLDSPQACEKALLCYMTKHAADQLKANTDNRRDELETYVRAYPQDLLAKRTLFCLNRLPRPLQIDLQNEDCSVCQCPFTNQPGEDDAIDLDAPENALHLLTLPCYHVFHRWCLEQVKITAQNRAQPGTPNFLRGACPLCRSAFDYSILD